MSRKRKKVCATLYILSILFIYTIYSTYSTISAYIILCYIEYFFYFSFYNYWIYSCFCFSFFARDSYRNEFCNRFKNLCNSCRNKKKYNSITKKKKKEHDNTVFLVKSKLNAQKSEFLRFFIDSNIRSWWICFNK